MGSAMGTVIPLRTDYSASELKLLAKRADEAGQARRLGGTANPQDRLGLTTSSGHLIAVQKTLLDHNCRNLLPTMSGARHWVVGGLEFNGHVDG